MASEVTAIRTRSALRTMGSLLGFAIILYGTYRAYFNAAAARREAAMQRGVLASEVVGPAIMTDAAIMAVGVGVVFFVNR